MTTEMNDSLKKFVNQIGFTTEELCQVLQVIPQLVGTTEVQKIKILNKLSERQLTLLNVVLYCVCVCVCNKELAMIRKWP